MLFIFIFAGVLYLVYCKLFIKTAFLYGISWWVWFFLSIPTTFLDVFTTIFFVNMWGVEFEGNPFLRFLFEVFGVEKTFLVIVPIQIIMTFWFGIQKGKGNKESNIMTRYFIFAVVFIHLICGINNVIAITRNI